MNSRFGGRRLAAALALSVAAAGAGSAAAFLPEIRGYALYHGYVGLPAQVMATDVPLPASASRCANCHNAPRAAARRLVALDRPSLTQPVRRRGGPPSAYDAASFCTALRDGVDPASVLLDRTMPRFAATDADCRALWRYVSAR